MHDLLLGRIHSRPGPQVGHLAIRSLFVSTLGEAVMFPELSERLTPSSVEEMSQMRAVVTRTTEPAFLFLPAWGI